MCDADERCALGVKWCSSRAGRSPGRLTASVEVLSPTGSHRWGAADGASEKTASPPRPATALWDAERMHRLEGRRAPPGTSPPSPDWSVCTFESALTIVTDSHWRHHLARRQMSWIDRGLSTKRELWMFWLSHEYVPLFPTHRSFTAICIVWWLLKTKFTKNNR